MPTSRNRYVCIPDGISASDSVLYHKMHTVGDGVPDVPSRGTRCRHPEPIRLSISASDGVLYHTMHTVWDGVRDVPGRGTRCRRPTPIRLYFQQLFHWGRRPVSYNAYRRGRRPRRPEPRYEVPTSRTDTSQLFRRGRSPVSYNAYRRGRRPRRPEPRYEVPTSRTDTLYS